MKNYASLSQSAIDLKETMPIKTSSLKVSPFVNVTPSPKKRSHSKAFGIERNTVVNVTNLSSEGIDEIFDNYFESTEMNKLFCPSEGETVQESITRRIIILDEIIENEEGISKYVQHSETHPLTTQQVQSLTTTCTALRASYYSALNRMAIVKNWSIVIQEALRRLCDCGIKATMNEKTIRRWHQWFRKHESFPHPNPYVQMGKKVLPKLFESYPKVTKMIHQFASNNLHILSSESLALHVREVILPQLHQKHIQESNANNTVAMNFAEFKKFLNVTHVDPSTCWRWLKMLGYKYVASKKCYFTDRHEYPKNIKDREVFIHLYLNYETNAYLWVHMKEDVAILLENDQNINLAKVYHSYVGADGVPMREYHVDIHPHLYSFVHNQKMGGDLSVRRNEGSRPVIIIGQDESVVKQYSFSSKCWQGVSGERKLLPKSDGYSLMISAFCSRAFGLSLNVTDEELVKINMRRTEGITSHYVSTESANDIYGSTLKKTI